MQIRPLTGQDAAAFLKLRFEALTCEPYAFEGSPEDLDHDLERVAARIHPQGDGSVILGAFDQHTLIGMAALRHPTSAKTQHKAYVWGVFVRPEGRGRGTGRALMTALIAWARTYPSIEQLVLSVAHPQQAARELYERLGFQSFGYEPHALKVGDAYIDEQHMVFWLQRTNAE